MQPFSGSPLESQESLGWMLSWDGPRHQAFLGRLHIGAHLDTDRYFHDEADEVCKCLAHFSHMILPLCLSQSANIAFRSRYKA